MSLTLLGLLFAGQTLDVCDVQRGRVPIGSPIEIEGRYISDFMHFAGLGNGDVSCLVSWNYSPEVARTPLMQRLAGATWKTTTGFPNTDQTDFHIRVRGHVEWIEPNGFLIEGGYQVVVTEVMSLSINGVPQ